MRAWAALANRVQACRAPLRHSAGVFSPSVCRPSLPQSSPSCPAETLPETKVVTIGGFKIGLCHGHQIAPAGEVEALAGLQRSLDVDVLVTGHTHRTSIAEYDGKCYINPGSLTGAYTPLARATAPAAAGGGVSAVDAAAAELGLPSNPNPSFMLMNIQDAKIDFFLYELTPEGKLRISKSTFAKAAGSGAGSSSAAKSVPAAGAGSAGPAGGKTHATGAAGSMAL